MAIEQKGFFKVPNGTTVYNGHCRGAVTLTSVSERLPVKLSSPVLNDSGLFRPGIDPLSPAREVKPPLR